MALILGRIRTDMARMDYYADQATDSTASTPASDTSDAIDGLLGNTLTFPLPVDLATAITALTTDTSAQGVKNTVETKALTSDLDLYVGDGPKGFDAYTGQSDIKELLSLFIIEANDSGDALPHIIVSGEKGLGKTALIGALAVESGRRIAAIVLNPLTAEEALDLIYEKAQHGDIIVFEEMHTQVGGTNTRKTEEWLLTAAEKGYIAIDGIAYTIPEVAFVGTTTDPSLLPEAILNRFKVLEVQPYTDAEAWDLTFQTSLTVLCERGLPLPSGEQVIDIAKACNNHPRSIKSFLQTLRTVAIDNATRAGIAKADRGTTAPEVLYDVDRTRSLLGVTADGLNREAQRYLLELLHAPKAVGLDQLKARLNVTRRGNLDTTENLLRRKDYVRIGGAGRELTPTGRTRAKAL